MSPSPVTLSLLLPAYQRAAAHTGFLWIDELVPEPWQSQLASRLGQPGWTGQHLPAAALVSSASGPVVCADPVHLRADRDTATLIPTAMLQLSDEESVALLESINVFLAADDLQVTRGNHCRWFVSGRDASNLASYPPSFLAHRNASAYLPEGEDSGDWRRLMTELQMLLHTHPVNSDRERRGLLPVNSVWFWGGASLDSGVVVPDSLVQSTVVFADDPFAQALARHIGMACHPLQAFDPAADHSRILLVDTTLTDALFARDEHAMHTSEQRIDDVIIKPLLARIATGDPVEIELLTEDGIIGRVDAQIAKDLQAGAEPESTAGGSIGSRLSSQLTRQARLAWQRLAGKSP